MNSPARRFYDRVKPLLLGAASDLPDFFTYYLIVEMEQPSATVKAVRECYEACDLVPPSWLASHFSNGLQKPRRFIKLNGGYRLENGRREEIAKLLGDGQASAQTSAALTGLEAKIPPGQKRAFLHETINCFEARANRAAVVMCWNLAVHHLQDHILADAMRHAAFNAELARNTNTRVKIKVVTKPDDFTEIPEGKFLLFCREAKLITSSMFHKLEGRLHERNTAAHPSGVKTTPKAAEAYIEDLVENVLQKFAA
jgi:hypothetical protein